MSGFFSAFKQFGHLGDLTDPELSADTTLFVVQRDGTFVIERDGTQVEDRRP